MAASLRELIVRINADSTVYQREMARASRMGSDYYRTMESGARRQDVALQRNQTNLRAMNSQMLEIRQTALRMTSVLASAFAIRRSVQTADDYGQMSSRIRMVTEDTEEYQRVQHALMETSDRTYKPLQEQQELFIRSASSMRELGYNTEQTLAFIDSMSSSLTINAASTDQGRRAIDAMSKSMVSGRVSGNEWRAVLEVMPTVVGDIARYMTEMGDGAQVSENQVKEMAANGKVSMELFANAALHAQQRNAELAESMPTTVEDAIQKLSNHWSRYLGEMNEGTATTETLAAAIDFVTDNLNAFVTAGAAFIALNLTRRVADFGITMAKAAQETVNNTRAKLAFTQAQLVAARRTQVETAAQVQFLRTTQASLVAQAAETTSMRQKAAIQQQLAANSAALAAAKKAETAATHALAAAEGRLNAVRTAGAGILTMLGGPAGLIAMLGTGAAAFFLFRSRAGEVADVLGDIEEPLDAVIERFRGLAIETQRATLINWGEAMQEEASKAENALSEIERSIRTRLHGVMGAGWRIHGQAITQALDEVREGSRSLDDALNEMEQRFGGRFGALTEGAVTELRLLAAEYVKHGDKAEDFNQLLMAGKGYMDQAASSAEGLGNSINSNAPSDDAIKAWERYNDQLREQIATLQDPSALGAANRRLDAMGIFDPVRRSSSLMLEMTKERLEEDQRLQREATAAAKRASDEALRNAERITQAYQQQADALQRQIALHGDNSRLAALRYDLEHGALRELSPQQASHLQALEEELALKEQLALASEQAREAARYEAVERQRLANLQADVQLDVVAVGRSDQAMETMRQLAAVQERHTELMVELQRRQEDESTRLTDEAYQQRVALLRELMNMEVGIVTAGAAAKRAAEADWENGARRGMETYLDNARNAAAQSELAMTNAMTGMEDAMARFVRTGKMSFTDLADSIINDLVRISIRQMALGISTSIFGGPPIAGGFMSEIPGMSEGGYTGPGGKYEPAGIVHRGEVVWSQLDVARAGGVATVEALRKGINGYANGGPVGVRVPAPVMPAGRQGSVSIPVSITVQAQPGMSDADAERQGQAFGRAFEGEVVKVIQKLKRPGGILS